MKNAESFLFIDFISTCNGINSLAEIESECNFYASSIEISPASK
jgi:hypothetical protein